MLRKRDRQADQTVEARITSALEALRPLLPIDGAVVELVEFEAATGVAVLRLAGDCPHCAMTTAMLRAGIEAQLRMRVPEVREVRALERDPAAGPSA